MLVTFVQLVIINQLWYVFVGNMKKVKRLIELPNADTNLTPWKADMNVEGSYHKAIHGCEGVFHMARPMDFESNDPETEVIKPTVEGMTSIIRSCAKANTVKKSIFTISAGTLNVEEQQKPVHDETNWSDLGFVHSKKMTGWMYFASKILAEKAAMEAAKENNINFISIILLVVVGPFIMPTLPPSLITALFNPYRGAIETCWQKGLLPYSTQIHNNGEEKEFILNSEEKEQLPTSNGKHSDNQEKEHLPTIKKHHAQGQEKCLLSDIATNQTNGKI